MHACIHAPPPYRLWLILLKPCHNQAHYQQQQQQQQVGLFQGSCVIIIVERRWCWRRVECAKTKKKINGIALCMQRRNRIYLFARTPISQYAHTQMYAECIGLRRKKKCAGGYSPTPHRLPMARHRSRFRRTTEPHPFPRVFM